MNELRVARILSVVLHPFVVSPIAVALATHSWRSTAIIAGAIVLPLVILLLRRTRRGEWSDFDVSQRHQRPGLYYVGIPCVALAALLAWWMGASPHFLRSFLAIGAVFVVGLLGNRFLKTSLHMLIGAFCAAVLWRVYPTSPFVTAPALAALAWSRWRLERHTPAEIAVGLLLGLAAGVWV